MESNNKREARKKKEIITTHILLVNDLTSKVQLTTSLTCKPGFNLYPSFPPGNNTFCDFKNQRR
jgi:hypothetical protein